MIAESSVQAAMLMLLSRSHSFLSSSQKKDRGHLGALVKRLGRIWLQRLVLPHELSRPDDVTVVIAVRNRCDYRLTNSLSSIRAQTYPARLMHIIVVDYGSEPASMCRTASLCEAYGAKLLRINEAPVWSRSRGLNVGIRHANTKYLMTSDADIIYSPRYVEDCIAALRRAPLSVVCAPMFDLPEDSTEVLVLAADQFGDFDLERWKEKSSPRFGWSFHPSITLTFSTFYKSIRGYDEFFELWGFEDEDLMLRFRCLGLQSQVLDSGSFYLHQSHPKFEGVPGGKENSQIRRNKIHFRLMHSIVRNDRGWGHSVS
jgi:glycosyltransferase involved in cell wall biosynthesis